MIMTQFNNPVEYLAALNNETGNAHVQIVRDWIARARNVRDNLSTNRPKRKQRMNAKLTMLIECRDALLAGQPNAFWSNQKARAQAAIELDIELGINS